MRKPLARPPVRDERMHLRSPASRDGRRRLTARPAVVVPLLALLLVATACGAAADEPRALDPATAQEIADEGVLRVDDLPGTGWTGAEGVDVDGLQVGPSDFFAGPECEPLLQLLAEGHAGAEDEAGPLARSERGFQAQEGRGAIRVLGTSVAVYSLEADATRAAEQVASSVTAGGLEPCLDTIVGVEFDGLRISGAQLSGPAAEVEGSSGATVDVEVFALFFTLDLPVHIYTFQRGHALASLVTLELNSDLLEREQQALLEAFASRVEQAHEGR